MAVAIRFGQGTMDMRNPMKLRRILLAALLAAAPLAAQPRSDTVLTQDVVAAIEEADLPIGLFEVEVRDGVAYLTGEVLDPPTEARVIEIALFQEGVVAVEADITVLRPDPVEEDEGEEAPGAQGAPEGGAATETSEPPLPPAGPRRDDAAIRAEIEEALADADLEARAPQVAVEDGVARLTGQVANAWEWGEVMERAGEVEGVAAVDPEMEVAAPESREDLIEGVRRAVLRYPYYTVFDDINFGLEGEQDVVLLGAVTEPFKKTEIEERVSKVFGVRSLDSRIEVLPLSPNDQDLRRALYIRIYRDPRFSDRANQVNPPIHIVVSRGVVALTGVVRSAIESRILESIARSTPGVFRVINNLQH